MSLFGALQNTAAAMDVYDRQFSVIQNNVANANTDGYARQTQSIEANRFDLAGGMSGGVSAGPVVSARSEYIEKSVRTQLSQLGTAEQQSSDLAVLESQFNLTSDSGVSGSINALFNSFSQLSTSPNDQSARQSVLDNAGKVAAAFNQTAGALSDASAGANTQIGNMVDNINQVAATIVKLNASYATDYTAASDSGLDTNMHAALEQLSELAGVSVIKQSDGGMDVYLAGGIPLVVGDKQFQIQESTTSSQTSILNADGTDVTSQITNGKLGGLLEERNTLLPSYSSQLDTIAQNLADQVNQQLSQGVDQNGNKPSTDLFSYDPTGSAAASLTVNSLTTDQIAAASADSPGGNGNALSLAALANAKLVNGNTLTGAFGNLGTAVGTDISTAKQAQTTQQSMLDQAKSLREQVSGVSLNDEAVELQQVQRAYQAAAKVMTTINSLLDTLMQAITPTG